MFMLANLSNFRAAVNVVDFDDKYIVSASGDRTIKVKTFASKFSSFSPVFLSGVVDQLL